MIGQSSLHNNTVYPLLRRFLQEGWVRKKTVPGDRGQTRQQYALTTDGRQALIERLSEFNESDAASEAAFRIRLGLLPFLTLDVQQSIFQRREKYLAHRDEVLHSLQEKMDLGKFGGEIVRYMRKQIEMEQEWIRHLRRMAKTSSRAEEKKA